MAILRLYFEEAFREAATAADIAWLALHFIAPQQETTRETQGGAECVDRYQRLRM